MIRRIVSLVLLAASGVALAQDPPAVRVAPFRGDRAAAINFMFDDGMRDQVVHAIPHLDRLKLRATFVINPGKTLERKADGGPTSYYASWEEWRETAAAGHEVANHSMTHPNLPKVADEAELLKQIDDAKSAIERRIERPVLTFCYPFNAVDDRVRQRVLRSHAFEIGPGRKRYGGEDTTVEQLNRYVDDAIAKRQFVVAMLHGVGTGYDHFKSPEVFQKHLEYVASKQDRIWVDTYANVVRYQREAAAAKVDNVVAKGRSVAFRISGGDLDPKVYDVPLTVVVPAKGATKATAKAGQESLPATVRGDDVLVDVVPRGQTVVVTWE